MTSNRRAWLALAALGSAAVIWALAGMLPAESASAKMFFDRANPAWPLTIQNFMWIFFCLGLGELLFRLDFVRANRRGLTAGYLSVQPGVFYDLADLTEIRRKIHGRPDLTARLIDLLTIRYQISHRAVDETHQMLNFQLELLQFRLDVDYNMIRYLTWLLPTLGFIGTCLGISNALAAAGQPGAAERGDFLSLLTGQLALAFDTTLLALLMSALIVLLMHLIQGQEERSLEQCGSYCLENLINKMISNYSGKL